MNVGAPKPAVRAAAADVEAVLDRSAEPSAQAVKVWRQDTTNGGFWADPSACWH